MKGRGIRDLILVEFRSVRLLTLALFAVVARLDSCLISVFDEVYRRRPVGSHFIATRDIECQGRDGEGLWRGISYAKHCG